MNSQEIKRITEQRINQLIDKFKKYPEKFLTEEDIRSYLYHLLIQDFNKLEKCEDGSKSIPIHCEIRWYGNSGKLRLISDIVILDVSTLRTKSTKSFKLPSKGYKFNKPLIIIETKLRRKGNESDNQFKGRIIKDRDRLREIKKESNGTFCSYILIFDKKNNLNFETQNYADNHKEHYVYPY